MISVAKLTGTFILFTISFLSGVMPYTIVKLVGKRFNKAHKYKTFRSVLNCFSAGVFFATTMLNLLPEALEVMEEVLNEAEKRGLGRQFKEYPFSELLIGVGFFLVLLIEGIGAKCCVQTVQRDKLKEAPCQKESNGLKLTKETEKVNQTLNEELQNVSLKETRNEEIQSVAKKETEMECIEEHETLKESSKSDCSPVERFACNFNRNPAATSASLIRGHRNHAIEYVEITRDSKEDNTNFPNKEEIFADDSFVTNIRKLRTFILLIALSLHMVFDGLALGLQKEDSKIWLLLGALSVHKIIVSFSVGLKLLETSPSTVVVLGFFMLFSIVSPAGMILGIVVTSVDGIDDFSRDIVSAILQGIATGTFMYVTFFELLFREVHESRNIQKMLPLIVGFMTIAAVKPVDSL